MAAPIKERSWISHPGLQVMVSLYNKINKLKWTYDKAVFTWYTQFKVSSFFFFGAIFKGLSEMKVITSEE